MRSMIIKKINVSQSNISSIILSSSLGTFGEKTLNWNSIGSGSSKKFSKSSL